MLKILSFIVLVAILAPFPAHAWQARVVAVSDGDTITVEPLDGGERIKVRLHGIDAPERKQPGGGLARNFLSEIALYKAVTIERKGVDRYRRLVAVVYLENGESLQALLLKAGLAWVWPEYCRNCGEWEALQEEARHLRRGLWNDGMAIPPWEWRKRKTAKTLE